MPVAAPAEGYLKMINYGRQKSALRMDQLALQAFMAGAWVAIYGHACTYFAGQFYKPTEPYTSALTKFAYGLLFPGAFVAVIYTGTELFTGNTVTMIMLLMNDGKKALKPLLRIWTFSLIGNLGGAVLGGFLISWCSGAFHQEGTPQRAYLFALATGKVSHGWGENVVLGIGCNALVCLATWCVVVSDDGAGKILAIFYSVGVFAMGGFEHVVANFYTLSVALMIGVKGFNFGEAVWKNWIPVLIGNMLAGTLLTGFMWWYALHPQYSDLAPFSNQELASELSRRATTATPEELTRWNRRSLSASQKQSSFFLMPHHLVPAPPGSPSSQPTREDYSIVQVPGRDGSPQPGGKDV